MFFVCSINARKYWIYLKKTRKVIFEGNMIDKPGKEIDLFIASRIGSFKHVKYYLDNSKNTKKCIENLVDIKSLQKDEAITCMKWGNEEQTEILIGKKNQQIQIYSTLSGITATHSTDFAPGHVVGLGRCKRKLLAATSSGVVRIWSKKTDLTVQTGGKLDVMKVFDEDSTIFATGGEENDLKIWRIGIAEPIFIAKNLPHDMLQLRQPVWVSGLAILPGCGGQLAAACSRHGYVRLYDTRAQRRPVVNVEFPKMAAICIAPSFEDRHLLVGFGRGQLHQVDLRVGRPDKGYKGASGAITDAAVSRRDRLVVSASLDRHLRIHEYQSKDLVYKQYLTSKLSAVLVQNEASTPLRNSPDEVKEEGDEDVKEEIEADDLDTLFDNMETVGEKPKEKLIKKKSSLPQEVSASKKVKPSTEGSTSIEDDAIAQLLRSTEKTKRRRDKAKREKKAKSVFHNA